MNKHCVVSHGQIYKQQPCGVCCSAQEDKMLDFYCVGLCALKPKLAPRRAASHVLVTSLWQRQYFSHSGSLEKTIWQNNEKVLVHSGSWYLLFRLISLLQLSGRIFNKPLG